MDNDLTGAEMDYIHEWLRATGREEEANSHLRDYYNRYYLRQAQNYFKKCRNIRSGFLAICVVALIGAMTFMYQDTERAFESDATYRTKKQEVRQIERTLKKKQAELMHIRDSLKTAFSKDVSKSR